MTEFKSIPFIIPGNPGLNFNYPIDDNGSAYYQPCEDLMVMIQRIVEDVNDHKKVYVRFVSGERKGSIAFIKKIINYRCNKSIQSRGYFSNKEPTPEYLFTLDSQLGWDDRKNTAKVKLFDRYVPYQLELLPDYDGPTVWKNIDLKNEAKLILEDNPPKDMRGKIINKDDKVVFINARYGSGAELDYGIVNEIVSKASFDYKGDCSAEITVVIHSLQYNNQSKSEPLISKIKYPDKSILIVNDSNIVEDMLLVKLSS